MRIVRNKMPHCICITQRSHFLLWRALFHVPTDIWDARNLEVVDGRWLKNPQEKRISMGWSYSTTFQRSSYQNISQIQYCMVLGIFIADQNASILFYIASAYLKIKFKNNVSSNYSPYACLNIFIPLSFCNSQYVCLAGWGAWTVTCELLYKIKNLPWH